METSYKPFQSGCAIDDFDELSIHMTEGAEHPVMWYVRNLPFEPALYPANMYHRSELTDDRLPGQQLHLMTWVPPAHDYERQKAKGCGFIRIQGSHGNDGLVYTACTNDKGHYAKAKKNHCWSLACPSCANDTALRSGQRVQDQLLSYQILMEKQGRDPGQLGHWVISPPQEYAKVALQTGEGYDGLRKHVVSSLEGVGATAGVLVTHPWRQRDDLWEFSPHFHSILYGFLNTDSFREDNEGWILKKVHASEGIESIAQTAAYLFTHMGLGTVERFPEEVDWDGRFLDYMLPGLSDQSKGRNHRGVVILDGCEIRTNAFSFTDEDRELQIQGRGRMCGEIGIDWLQWTMDPLFSTSRILYFGGANSNNLRTVAVEKGWEDKVCKDCGSPLNLYNGRCDIHGQRSQFMFENPIRAFRQDIPAVKAALADLRLDLSVEGMKVSEISPKVSMIVSKTELTPNG